MKQPGTDQQESPAELTSRRIADLGGWRRAKLTFAKGAALKDPARLFNASLDGNVRRAIDIREGEDVDETAFKTLIQ